MSPRRKSHLKIFKIRYRLDSSQKRSGFLFTFYDYLDSDEK